MVTYANMARLVIDTVNHELRQLREDLGDAVDDLLFHDDAMHVLDAGAQLMSSYEEFAQPGDNDRYVDELNKVTGAYA